MIHHCETPRYGSTLCNPTKYLTTVQPHANIEHCNYTLWYNNMQLHIIIQSLQPHDMIQHCNPTLFYNTVQPNSMIQQCVTPRYGIKLCNRKLSFNTATSHYDSTLCNPTLWYNTVQPQAMIHTVQAHTMIEQCTIPRCDKTLCNTTLWYNTVLPQTMIQHCATTYYNSKMCNHTQW
jgi:hypothetical protein